MTYLVMMVSPIQCPAPNVQNMMFSRSDELSLMDAEFMSRFVGAHESTMSFFHRGKSSNPFATVHSLSAVQSDNGRLLTNCHGSRPLVFRCAIWSHHLREALT